jgi:hypothetical protein
VGWTAGWILPSCKHGGHLLFCDFFFSLWHYFENSLVLAYRCSKKIPNLSTSCNFVGC